ncbi:BTAD domain-containing putative transcriptional regulator [Streptomyces sp. NPDC057245]|uniref:SARP family regulator n=1 Tax=Streptomyces sp. FXJ8.102 TaxID=1581323 RepID=A0A7L4WPG8_9ACTN|nr:AfsR/SARP family transcriptional regulator [Streptomyces sp. A108]QFS19033.1 SARP family regulator [Streptomyces sp. FXJ8.102]
MEFSVLGPLRMYEGGKSYTPTAPKQRQLLTLLLLNANQVVSTDTCIEELWENSPPNSALSTLQSYILQLRRSLRRVPRIGSLQAARLILETRDGGYLLAVRSDELDTNRFWSLVREGRSALHHDDVRASACLSEALRLWQGSALSDVQRGPVLRALLVGLEEERTSVQEQRIAADLRLGRHQELLGELSRLTAKYPMHEGLHAQFMLALHRTGRRTQALEVLRRLGTVLRDELGLDPSPRVRRLHQAILAGDPALDVPARTDSVLTAEPGAPIGRRLPAGGDLVAVGAAAGRPEQLVRR